MNKGYAFESEVEYYFLSLEGKSRQDPIFDGQKIVRSFRVPASGMMASLPGDVVTANPNFPQQFMVECKARTTFTKKKGQIFRLDYGWVTKNEEEAQKAGYLPLLMFSFKRTKKNRIWVVLPKKVFGVLWPGKELHTEKCINKKNRVLFIKDELDNKPEKFYILKNNIVTSFELFWDKVVSTWKK